MLSASENKVSQARINEARSSTTSRTSCPVCGGSQVQAILTIPQVPILANVLWDRREDALAAPRGDLQLAFCETCGHVYNQAFDPAAMAYDVQYENSLHFSPRFQQYADWLARYLIDKYGLQGKKIVEIGSGKGDFLRMLCEIGSNTGTGFDPSHDPAGEEAHPALSFIKDVYSERYANTEADLVLSRHVLEHIDQPAKFAESLRRTLQGTQTVIYCEVPNFGYILRDTAVWDLIYEHVSYFSAGSLEYLFSSSGFNVLNLADGFDGQFLSIEAVPGSNGRQPLVALRSKAGTELADQVTGFAYQSQAKLERWRKQLQDLQENGKRAVLWGAGSKGISFLNMLHVDNAVEYIVDINPRKHGKFVTGAGQQIVSPMFLAEYRPDTVIVMNPIYRDEIQGMASQIGLNVDLLTAS